MNNLDLNPDQMIITEDKLFINETDNSETINSVEETSIIEENTTMISMKYDKQDDNILIKSSESKCIVNYTKENVNTNSNILNSCIIDDHLYNKETENINFVNSILLNKKTDNSISNEKTDINLGNNEPTKCHSIEEAWNKHLFWPRPNNLDSNKRKKRSQIKLPYAVSAVQWREHHTTLEKEKLRKEGELCLKRKRREEIKC